jgi:hypothetical protein
MSSPRSKELSQRSIFLRFFSETEASILRRPQWFEAYRWPIPFSTIRSFCSRPVLSESIDPE